MPSPAPAATFLHGKLHPGHALERLQDLVQDDLPKEKTEEALEKKKRLFASPWETRGISPGEKKSKGRRHPGISTQDSRKSTPRPDSSTSQNQSVPWWTENQPAATVLRRPAARPCTVALSDQPSGSQSSSKRSRRSDQKRRKIRKRNKLKAASPLNFLCARRLMPLHRRE